MRVKEVDAKEEQDDIEADYIIDEKARTATLTPKGQARAEAYFKIDNLNDPENSTLQHHINRQSKRAASCRRMSIMLCATVRSIIVDEFTSRLMFGRRYNEGLHQAIEAEGVKVHMNPRRSPTIYQFQEELLPPVRQAVRHDRYGADRGRGVPLHL